jgi:caa(3)-type oxidase subunit IV
MAHATSKHVSPHYHPVPLWGLFLALLVLTAAEVGLYEVWTITAKNGDPFIPKLALVLILIIVLTLPKAAIVLIYFMHVKFEKQLIVLLALVPFVFVFIAVLPTLTDIMVLREHVPPTYHVKSITGVSADHHGHGESPEPAAPAPDASGY